MQAETGHDLAWMSWFKSQLEKSPSQDETMLRNKLKILQVEQDWAFLPKHLGWRALTSVAREWSAVDGSRLTYWTTSWGVEGRWGWNAFRKCIQRQLQLLLARSLDVSLSFGRPQAKEFHAPFPYAFFGSSPNPYPYPWGWGWKPLTQCLSWAVSCHFLRRAFPRSVELGPPSTSKSLLSLHRFLLGI